MAKSSLKSNQLPIFLLISTLCIVWSLPANSEISLERRHEPLEDVFVTGDIHGDDGVGRPVYEYQLTIYPAEYLGSTQNEVSTTTIKVPTSSPSPVVPTMGSWPWQKPQTTTVAPTSPQKEISHDIQFDIVDDIDHTPSVGVTVQHPVVQKPHPEVIEQYQVVHHNGTAEHKLVLSNGLTNYKKIYSKLSPEGKVITIQEGFDSVPLPSDDPHKNEFLTQFYIADEHGNNVYRVEKNTRQPHLPEYLNYKTQLGKF